MTREELEPLLTHIRLDLHDIDQQISWAKYLLTHIRLDLHDIDQQISWAKYQQKAEGIEYDHRWMRGAIKAARIKEADIEKIDDLLEGMPYTRSKAERDIIELKRAVRKFLVNRLLGTELEEMIRELDEVYGR
jgi:hypothetical protein